MGRVLPILFNTEMVQAVLDDRKTVTRRCVKPQLDTCPSCMHVNYTYDKNAQNIYCPRCGEPFEPGIKPPYQPGDILYVREKWNYVYDMDDGDKIVEGTGRYIYYADASMPFSHWVDPDTGEHKEKMPWRPSIHMPKDAARIWLKVTDVRVERLQDITEEQAKEEGANWKDGKNIGWEEKMRRSAIERFAEIWNSTIKKADFSKCGWDANPWVWVIEFERCGKP